MTLIELRQQREALIERASALAQNTNLTAEEFQTQVAALNQERSTLDARINLMEQNERDQQARANQAGRQAEARQTEETKVKKRFSIIRAMNLAIQNRPLDGVEAEMDQEARKEAREAGVNVAGQIAVPSMLFRSRSNRYDAQQRATMVVGTANVGGNTVATELSSELIPFLNPALQVEALGARVLTGLQGNVDIARKNAKGNAVWETEVSVNDETNPTFDLVQLRPKRLGAFSKISKTLLTQSSFDVEQLVREDLNNAVAIAWDLAAINGTGTGQPLGILNYSGIGSVVGGTNGLAPTLANIIKLETECAIDDALMGNLAYLTTPGIRGYLKGLQKFSGGGMAVWGEDQTLNGYRTAVSTQVPSNLVKGTSSNCNAIIFGNWSELILAQWGGIDLVINPYTLAKEATVEVVINSWVDVGLRHEQSFAAMKDALAA